MIRPADGLMKSVAILFLYISTAHADTIADSIEDWSPDGIQGENNWTYGYYNLTLDEEENDGEYQVEDFIPFLNDESLEVGPDGENHWTGSQWRLYRDGEGVGQGLANTGPWTRIGANDFGHPNGTNSAAPTEVDDAIREEHWAIRRWESEHNGPASVEIFLTAQNLNCGNGTAAHLFHNGELIDTLFEPNFGDPEESTNSLNLKVGDLLDLALSPEGEDEARGDSCDGSFFHMTVISEGDGLVGDFNNNGVLDLPDINMLVWESAGGANDASFDLNNDNLVNGTDVNIWVKDLKNTWIGDANLDSEFNTGDLVGVFQAGLFETDQDAGWSEGDWTGDHRFGTGDLVAAFQEGGFEQGPPAGAVNAVPEPACLSCVLLGMISIAFFGRKRR